MHNPNSYISMLWNIVYSVDGMFRRVSKCRRNLHATLELGLISMTSRHPGTRPPSQLLHGLATVLLLIGIQVGGFRRDVVPGAPTRLEQYMLKNWKFAWKLRQKSSVFGSGNPKHHGVARIDLHTSFVQKGLRTHNLSGAARQDWGSSSEPCGCTFLGLTTRGLMLKSHFPFDLPISPWCMGCFFISVGASPVSVSFVWVSTLNRSDHSDFDVLQLQVLQSLCSRVGLVMPWPLSQHEWCHWCHEELNNLPRDDHGDNARFRHYGKFSPCDGEHLRSCSFLCDNSGMARRTFVCLCSISKHIVKPWNAQWLMPRGWATCGCVWWVSWGPGWYFKTSDVLV